MTTVHGQYSWRKRSRRAQVGGLAATAVGVFSASGCSPAPTGFPPFACEHILESDDLDVGQDHGLVDGNILVVLPGDPADLVGFIEFHHGQWNEQFSVRGGVVPSDMEALYPLEFNGLNLSFSLLREDPPEDVEIEFGLSCSDDSAEVEVQLRGVVRSVDLPDESVRNDRADFSFQRL